MTGSKDSITVQRLKDESNYMAWSQRAEAYLMVHNHIESINHVVEKAGPKWMPKPILSKDKDYKALAALKLLVHDGPLNHIIAAETLCHGASRT